MIEGLQPYADYKESEIPWAPSLPMTWQTERAKRLFTKMQRPVRPEDEVVTCFRDGRVTLRKNRRLRGFTEATAFSGYQGIRKGDLVIHGMDAFAGAIGVSDSDGKGTPVYNVCQPRLGVVAGYYAHTVREMSRAQWILALAKGIRERSTDFRYEMFGNQFIPFPPPDEQAAIVRFLDHANRKIEGFIRAKRKLIALLGEQKQAIIHRAVTGKDEVRMMKDESGTSSFNLQPSSLPKKPSGIPWLGEIPMHWEVTPLKGVCNVQSGVTLGKTYTDTSLTEFPYLRVANVQAGRLALENIKTLRLPAAEARHSMLQVGDVLMTEGGDPDKLGRGCVWNGEIENCIHQNHVFAVRPSLKRMRPHYLSALLETHYAKTYFLRTAKQTTNLASTNKTTIGQFRLLLPPIAEQDGILVGMASELSPLNTAIARTEREIALMQEYRTRLTADVVTGKLDVRPAAVELPNLPATPEPLADDVIADEPEIEEN